jgi:hypothetical protein
MTIIFFDIVESEFTPHFYGGCWASFGTTVFIEEYLRGYMVCLFCFLQRE